MVHHTTTPTLQEGWIAEMSRQMAEIGRQASEWVMSGERTLEEMEKLTIEVTKGLGQALLSGLCRLKVPEYPADTVACSCGATAKYVRWRTVHTETLLGRVELERPYYLCPSCHHGLAPLDQQLGFCAGGRSVGLDEVLALVGAQVSFEEAVELIRRLTLVDVCANSCWAATEGLGRAIVAEEKQALRAAWEAEEPSLPPLPEHVPERLYVSMDGTTVHIAEEGWREMKLAAFYTTKTAVSKKRPEQVQIRAQELSFYVDFADPQTFGQAVWLEGYRRGVTQAKEVVALGDGAAWIWRLVEQHFPQALQIVDWYHASEHLWGVAQALFGEGSDLAKQWAQARLDELWKGQMDQVLLHLNQQAMPATWHSEVARQALTYYTHNRERMRYPEYRAKGLQIGSGSIESGCKHIVGARLKQAG